MLGVRIAQQRCRLGWSQAQLARRLNISPSTVGMYEQGRREPSAEMLLTLSRVLGVSLEFLLTGTPSATEAQTIRTAKEKGEKSLMDFLRTLNREELLVLLTAELIGSSCQDI